MEHNIDDNIIVNLISQFLRNCFYKKYPIQCLAYLNTPINES